MMAGVMAYKLCEREYQCESCPLDMEMRHAKAEAFGRPRGYKKIANKKLHFSAPLFYSANHTWVRLEGSRGKPRARACTLLVDGQPVILRTPLKALVGLDDFIIRLIAKVNRIVLPEPGTPISRGDALATLIQDPHTFKVSSPISGRVGNTNLTLLDSPQSMIQNPAEKSWLAYLQPDNFFAELKDLLDGPEALSWQQNESKKLEALVGTLCTQDRERLGALMHDGKEINFDSLVQMVGPERYYRLVLSFLGEEREG
jgi:glycine cleavage system H lipoate-binding protein